MAITQTGGSFTTVALPWLVLGVTGNDAFIMSTVLGTLNVPTGIFLLFGGALADRFSALRTLWVSRVAFAALMLSLAACCAWGAIPIALLYAYALLLGVVIAIGIPASQALLPALVPQFELGKANGILFATLHVAQVLGPFTAGWLIFWGRERAGLPPQASSAQSIAPAFAVDAGLTVLALGLMAFMRVEPRPAPRLRILPFLREGLEFCRRDRGICTVLIYLMLASLFLQGPLMVSLPLVTKVNLGMLERTLGALYAVFGAGVIAGAGAAVAVRPSSARLGAVVLCCDFIVGVAFTALGQARHSWIAGALLFAMGGALGLTMVAGTTWFQARTPGELMGRVMSFVMFAIFGLTPISAFVAGYLLRASSVGVVTAVAGVALSCVAAIGLTLPNVRRMGIPQLERSTT